VAAGADRVAEPDHAGLAVHDGDGALLGFFNLPRMRRASRSNASPLGVRQTPRPMRVNNGTLPKSRSRSRMRRDNAD